MNEASHEETVYLKEAISELTLEDTCLLIVTLSERLAEFGLKEKFEKIQSIMMEVSI